MEIQALIQKVMTSDKVVVPENAALIGGAKENFLEVGCDLTRALLNTAPLTPTSHILEIGSGLGRVAYPLAFYLEGGRYVGVEIVKHMVDFCKTHITPLANPNTSIEFLHLDCYNEFYNPESKTQLAEIEFPNLGDFDIVFMSSVCTHLEDKELQLYFQKAAKWLRPGGTFWATFFLIDEAVENKLLFARPSVPWAFDLSSPGPDYYLDQRRSTLAVSYYPEYVKSRLAEAGLLAKSIYFASWSGVRTEGGTQDLVVAQKVRRDSKEEQSALHQALQESRDAVREANLRKEGKRMNAKKVSQPKSEPAGSHQMAGEPDTGFDPTQILLLAEKISKRIHRSVIIEEVEHAAGLIQRRLAMPDIIAAYTKPDPPVRDVERALLEINAEQAQADGTLDLAELYRRIVAIVDSGTPEEDGWKALVAEADRVTGEGRMDDALAILIQCAGKYPRQSEVHALLATVLSFRKRYSEAADVLRRAISCAPNNARLHAMMGTLMTLQGNLPAAESAYASALQIDPGYVEAKTNLDVVRKNMPKPASPGMNPSLGLSPERQNSRSRSMEAYADMIRDGFQREAVTEVPPEDMVALVIGKTDVNAYRDTGKSVYLDFSLILLKYFQKTWNDFGAILDFGVGSGRIARWLPTFAQTRLYGVDVNEESILWCRKNLIGTYTKNDYDPPLAFPDGFFDCVYSFSVFSHMDNETAAKWVKELHRVTQDGGIVMATTHLSWASTKLLNPDELKTWREQGYVYREYNAAGSEMHNTQRYINSFVTERHVWELWKDHFELIGITAGNNKMENVPIDWEYEKPQFDMGQGVVVLRKISGA